MATYSLVSNGSNADYIPDPSADPTGGLISAWRAGQTDVNIVDRLVVYHQVSAFSTLRTPAKLNTRSASPRTNNYFRDGIGQDASRVLILGQLDFGTNAWRAHPRWCPWTDTAKDATQGALDVEGSLTVGIFDEEIQGRSWAGGGRRRCRKPGFWNMAGNTINRVAVTGGGAFNTIYPVFQNDLTWIDSSAWRNGSNRQSTWNINIFGNMAPQRMLVGAGI